MPPDTPTVSVVMPTFNGARWLVEAVDSVLAQTGVDLELVIADHGSTDSTAEVAQRYAEVDPRVRFVRTPAGGGAHAGWNGATRAARGTFLKLVCQDDTLLPGVLARQVSLLDAHPGAALTACRRDLIDEDGRTLMEGWGLRGLTRPLSGEGAIVRAVAQGINPFGEPGCVMTRRDLLERVGGWHGERPYVIDLATYFALLRVGTFVPDLEVGATFRVSSAQLSFRLRDSQARQVTALHAEAVSDLGLVARTLARASGTATAYAAQAGRRLVYLRDRLRKEARP